MSGMNAFDFVSKETAWCVEFREYARSVFGMKAWFWREIYTYIRNWEGHTHLSVWGMEPLGFACNSRRDVFCFSSIARSVAASPAYVGPVHDCWYIAPRTCETIGGEWSLAYSKCASVACGQTWFDLESGYMWLWRGDRRSFLLWIWMQYENPGSHNC